MTRLLTEVGVFSAPVFAHKESEFKVLRPVRLLLLATASVDMVIRNRTKQLLLHNGHACRH